MVLTNLALAQRLEGAQAAYAAAGAHAWRHSNPRSGADVEVIGDGCAVFLGADSPLTHALGLGMKSAVTTADIDRVENFYRDRDTTVKVDVCPLADPSLIDVLGRRGYRPVEFANVMVAEPAPLEQNVPGPALIEAAPQGEPWARLLARSFFEHQEVTPALLEIGLIIFASPKTQCLVALDGGELVSGAALATWESVSLFFADATTPESRNRGLQTALIRARLHMAHEQGCALATADTMPGSPSQRHYERCGFRVAYTKMIMERTL